MVKKAYLAKINEEVLTKFVEITQKNGFKKTNEAVEIIMQMVNNGTIDLRKEISKTEIKVEING